MHGRKLVVASSAGTQLNCGCPPHAIAIHLPFYTRCSLKEFRPGPPSVLPNHVTYTTGRKISVSSEATSSPPMTAKAIGPQKTVKAIGIRPSTVETAVSMIGRKRDKLRLDDRIPYRPARGPLGLDLLDQDHRVARDHPDQREDA